jgi:prepilin-type N-terminal cleavage/methylation domain-containing protein/prepilin-type processing-associated H-X9-DG protein
MGDSHQVLVVQKRGFTLMELLVVMSIISILVALIIPALTSARQTAAVSSCVSNLRQIYLGLSMHADDNSERYPEAQDTGTWGVTNAGWVGWMEQINPYIKDPKIYRCPRQPQDIENNFSYFLGSRDVFVTTGTFGPIFRSNIQLPEQYILAGDCTYNFVSTDTDKDNYVFDCLFTNIQSMSKYHLGKANVLFGDGHVKAYKEFIPGEMTYSFNQPGVGF